MAFEAPQVQQELERVGAQPDQPAQPAAPAAPQPEGRAKLKATVAFETPQVQEEIDRAAQQVAAAQPAQDRVAEAQPQGHAFAAATPAPPQAGMPPTGGAAGPKRVGRSHLSSTVAFEAQDVRDAVDQAIEADQAQQQPAAPAAPPADPVPAAPLGTQGFAAVTEPQSRGETAAPRMASGRSHLSSTVAFEAPQVEQVLKDAQVLDEDADE